MIRGSLAGARQRATDQAGMIRDELARARGRATHPTNLGDRR
jgi:hypothetical protein